MFRNWGRIIYILSALVSCLFLVLVIMLNVVPIKYLLIIIGVLVIIYGVLGSISFKIKGKLAISFFSLIELMLGIIFGYGAYIIYETNDFFGQFSNIKDEYALYYVAVLKDSNYEQLTDLTHKTVGTYELNDINFSKAFASINEKVSLTATEFTNLTNLANGLLQQKVDSIIINEFTKDLLATEVNNFKDSVKILHTQKVVVKKKKEQPSVQHNAFNVLISGIDTNGDINKVSRSDVNIVMTINPATHEVLLTNIPRDMYVQLAGTTGVKDKLTHAGIYGIDMSRKTVENFLSIKIPYYLRVNFDSLIRVVDAIGGIDITNDVAFQGRSRYFSKGEIHLNGKQALEYSRERKKMPAGDWTRGLHQEVVVKAIIHKVTSSAELLTNYSGILNSLTAFMQTNIPANTLKKYVKDQLATMRSWNVENYAISGQGSGYIETYSMPGSKLYVTYPEEASVKYGSKVINEILNNQKYNEIK